MTFIKKKLKKFILTRIRNYAHRQWWDYDGDWQLFNTHKKERDSWFDIKEALDFLISEDAEEAL